MTTTTKPSKHQCRYCGTGFDKSWKVSSHILTDHANDKPRLREVSCWACAGFIDPNVTNTCSCGFVHPYIVLPNN